MVFTVDTRYSLPHIHHGLGVVQPSSPQSVSGLYDSDPFLRSGPLKRKMSQRISTCQVLPTHACQSEILRAIGMHQVVLLTAPPASGKTTQVPQMVLDDALVKQNLCRIAVSNPKTLGVIGCSGHVSSERGEESTVPAAATEEAAIGYIVFVCQ